MKKPSLTIKTMINKRFIMIRKYFNLTQEEMSRKLGISVTSISTIENERQLPTLSLTISLIDIFHISPLWLLKGEGEMFIKDKEPELNQQEYFKKAFPGVPADAEVIKMIDSLSVPILKNALVVKYLELKDLYRSKIEGYEKEKNQLPFVKELVE
jgi:DNA-binding XRE family transcriptional regulator